MDSHSYIFHSLTFWGYSLVWFRYTTNKSKYGIQYGQWEGGWVLVIAHALLWGRGVTTTTGRTALPNPQRSHRGAKDGSFEAFNQACRREFSLFTTRQSNWHFFLLSSSTTAQRQPQSWRKQAMKTGNNIDKEQRSKIRVSQTPFFWVWTLAATHFPHHNSGFLIQLWRKSFKIPPGRQVSKSGSHTEISWDMRQILRWRWRKKVGEDEVTRAGQNKR